MKFYSQQKEDKFIYDNFINQKTTDGKFLEMGAMDGIKYSNTKFFEDELGFSGVLIEPVSKMFKKLVKNRPNCNTYNCAVSTKDGSVEIIGNGATAGIVDTMSDSFRNRWHSKTKEINMIETCRLDSILHEAEIEYIDFWSLDVEGAEYDVLQTMDWSIPIYVMEIELNRDDLDKDEKCRKILKEVGMKFHSKIGKNLKNDIWWNENYFRKDLLFKD